MLDDADSAEVTVTEEMGAAVIDGAGVVPARADIHYVGSYQLPPCLAADKKTVSGNPECPAL